MRARVAPNHMASRAQFSNLIYREEGRLSDIVCRDEEVAAPPVALQQGGGRKRACAAIVESKQNSIGSDLPSSAVQQQNLTSMRRLFDRFQVVLEFRAPELVDIGVSSRKTTAGKLSRRNNIVVKQRYYAHRFFDARFTWADPGCRQSSRLPSGIQADRFADLPPGPLQNLVP